MFPILDEEVDCAAQVRNRPLQYLQAIINAIEKRAGLSVLPVFFINVHVIDRKLPK
jgi:hypothetical protein